MKFKVFSLALIVAFIVSGCVTARTKNLMDTAKMDGVPLIIGNIYTVGPNSAGGATAKIKIINTSSQTIKYVTLTLMPYNAVGDVAPSEIGEKTTARVRFTGPITPDDMDSGTWEPLWYNHSIRCIELVDVEIIYMNGSKKYYSAQEKDKMLVGTAKKSCSI